MMNYWKPLKKNSWLSLVVCSNVELKFVSIISFTWFGGNTKQKYVIPKLKECYFATPSFDLWMSNGAHDVFALVMNFLGIDQ
jgi:hypothetical protein